jgi:polyisoprenoid-binding protein YceI
MTVTTAALPGLTTGTWAIDASHTEVGFTVRHAMVGKTRGRFSGVQGVVVVGADAQSSSAQATIDMASIDTRDDKRDAHLRSADFFDVDTFPTMTFASTGVRADGEDYLVDGDLTIRGVTRPVVLRVEFGGVATDPFGYTRAGFSAETEINRKDFGLTWNAALEAGGVLVGDKVKISLEVEVVRQDADASA